MKVAVLSGKGGTGKTFVSANLAAVANRAAYIDCDVEEPNGRLFLKPENCSQTEVFTLLPEFDLQKCNGCRKCVDFCRFNALVYVQKKPMLFPGVCHSCGGCALVCPEGAVTEIKHPVGIVEHGRHGSVEVVTGVLNMGEESAVPVIKAALTAGEKLSDLTVIDCPPGSGCSVMESVMESDCCVLVVEPTAFGFHNFRMVHELASLMKKPCFVVINKEDAPYSPLEDYCTEIGVPVVLRIPYSAELARLGAKAKLASEENEVYAAMFRGLLDTITREVKA